MIADQVAGREGEHRARVLDRAPGDDRHGGALGERAKPPLHLLRHAGVPRPLDDRRERAVDIEREQRPAASETPQCALCPPLPAHISLQFRAIGALVRIDALGNALSLAQPRGVEQHARRPSDRR